MKNILKELIDGKISISDAEDKLKIMQIQEMGSHVKFDTMREIRVGVPEAIYSQGKTDEDLINIINNIDFTKHLMITRLPEERFNRIKYQLNKNVLKNGTYF